MRVEKTINGFKYSFFVYFLVGERKARVKYFHSDEETICEVSEDFNYILLPPNKFEFDGKSITKLKMNKVVKMEFLDYYEKR